MNKQERSFRYDKVTKEYILEVKNETPIKKDKVVQGVQSNHLIQRWNEDAIDDVRKQLTEEENKIKEALKTTESQFEQLGKITERDRQNNAIFKKKMEMVQKIQKYDQLTAQKKSQEDMLKALTKDKKEIEDAIANRPAKD